MMEGTIGNTNGMKNEAPVENITLESNTPSPPEPKKAKKDMSEGEQKHEKRKRTPSPWRFPTVDRAQDRRKSDGGNLLDVPNCGALDFSPDSTSIDCCPSTIVDSGITQTGVINVNNCAVDKNSPSYMSLNPKPSHESAPVLGAGNDCPVPIASSQVMTDSRDVNGVCPPENLGPLLQSPGCDINTIIISPTSGHCSYISSTGNVNGVVDIHLGNAATSPVEKGVGSTSSSPVDEHKNDPFHRPKLERSDDVCFDGTKSPPDDKMGDRKSQSDTDMKIEIPKTPTDQDVSSSSESHSEDSVSTNSEENQLQSDASSDPNSPAKSPFKVPVSPVRFPKPGPKVGVDPLLLRSTSPFSPLCSPKVSPHSHGKYNMTQVMNLLESRIPKLLTIMDFTSSEPLEDLKFVKRRTNYNPDNSWRIHVADKMEELGIVQLLIRIWNSLHQEDGNIDKTALTNIIQVVSTLWNTTDISRSLCEKITRSGAISLFLEDLRNEAFSSVELEKEDLRMYYVKGIMGIMQNICRHYRDSRDVFRDAMAVESLQGYLGADNPTLKLKVLILLSYIISEDENAIINADDSNIRYIIEILKSATESEGHFSKKYGFCASELVHGLNHLVANDANKERVVKNALLPLYVSLLGLDCKPEEQKFAARGIWILAFNEYCKRKIKEEKGCLEALQQLITHGTEEGVRHAARGALWEISARWKVSSISHDADTIVSEAPHVMISYQWDSKPTMLKVKDRLKAEGYKVWMDVENMSGSTLEAMALAVEKASVVILSVSQRYKDSPNCRSEAEYAYRLRRSTIPLILQKEYVPDGWLGMMVGTKLYFDFSEELMFNASMDGLIRELGDRGRVVADGGFGVCDFVARTASHESYTTCSNTSSPVEEAHGSEENVVAIPQRTYSLSQISEVKQWLEHHGLSRHCDKFEDFNCDLLQEMKRMQEVAPDFLYRTLQSEYGFKLRDILQLNCALRKANL